MRRKRRRPGERPIWSARHVDATIEQVHPISPWLLVREDFTERKVGKIIIADAPGTINTVAGVVVRIGPDVAEDLGVAVGDHIVYQEWQGSRWAFQGVNVLMINAEHILARVV